MKSITARFKMLGVLVLALVSVVSLAAPAHARDPYTYASTPLNGMWHMGTIQFYNGDNQFNATIRFNDLPGDAYCTQLRMRAYTQNQTVTQFTIGSICGGRTGNLSNTITASGSPLVKVEVWTVRADARLRSHLWWFTP
jgi:hypothetical protein